MKLSWHNLGSIVALSTACSVTLTTAAELSWHEENGFRWAELPPPSAEKAGFTRLLPEDTGIYFTNEVSDLEIARNRMLADGSGVAIGDFDRDGLPDVFLCALNGHCALYKNLGGYKFKDVIASSGIVCTNYICRGAVFADINGDGWLDLLMSTTGNGVLTFTNKHDGTFADVSQSTGLLSEYGASTVTLADVDGNEQLDVYVANRRKQSFRDRADIQLQMVDGKISIPPTLRDQLTLSTHGVVLEYGDPDQLYLNDGRGKFTPFSWTNGGFLDENGKPLEDAPRDWGLTAMFHDVNGDGAPDLYVCNDFWSPDRFWLNDGKGHFRAIPREALRHTSASSMGVDFADIDRDGQEDFLVVGHVKPKLELEEAPEARIKLGLDARLATPGDRPQVVRNTLFHNRGDGTFEEIAGFAGLTGTEWSWQPVFMDADLDGWDDVFAITGFHRDIQDRDMIEKYGGLQRANRLLSPKLGFDGKPAKRSRQELITDGNFAIYSLETPLKTPIAAYRNQGGLKFGEAGPEWGLDENAIRTGIALGDLDETGNLDFVVNTFRGPAEIYRHHVNAPRVAVRVKGLRFANPQGIEAKIKLLHDAVPMQNAEVISGGYYLSLSDTMRVFATGQSTNMTIEITWRNGKVSTIHNVKPNREYEIDEAGALPPAPVLLAEKVQPLFQDVSSLIAHKHHEEFFNDFERQPLLPYQLSQDGPGVAWADIDGSGHDALFVGSGRGGQLETFLPEANGKFIHTPSTLTAADDLTGLAAWIQPGGKRSLLVGQASYETITNLSSTLICSRESGRLNLIGQLPATASTGPIAVADMDADGLLDVFVGERVIPGRYPEPASSKIYRNDGKQLVLDVENNKMLNAVGLVSGAVWSDLDGDGFPELILACEWGPIRVFKNQAGRLHEITKELGLDQYTGWWRGVTTGDIDGDGRMDIIASNWGLNSDYQASPEHPAQLFYGDFTDRGADALVETAFDTTLQAVVPRRDRQALETEFPYFARTFPTHKTFSEATMQQILDAIPQPAHNVQATTLASMIFFNRTNHFEPRDLPREAQLAPAFGITVADFDGDGNEDIFLSQNFFQGADREPRLDAGRGLLLRGIGNGKLAVMPGQQSGILIYGQQRGAAVGDFNEDGRVDLAVAQNGEMTKLYKNVNARPGLRVRLHGLPGNPDGIGATVQAVYGQRPGPACEIHSGSGYWSQDSVAQILGGSKPPTKLQVRWPGGRITDSEVPSGAKSITIEENGKVTVVK